MGNAQTASSPSDVRKSSIATEGRNSISVQKNGLKPMRERLRYGVCTVKISLVVTGQRRNSERQNSYVISPKGSILHGSQCNPQLIQRALISSGFPILAPGEIPLGDSRAHKLLVVYSNGWHAIPSPEVFSRHSGTCVVLGDRTAVNPPYKIKLGDCFRLGSVGVVVSEIRYKDEDEQRLDSKMLQYLKDEALTLEVGEELATLAVDEGDQYHDENGPLPDKENEIESVLDTNSVKSIDPNGGGIGGGEKFICYMCYETHDTQEDPLVAPCECRGDTRYLHVQCLQKWYQSSVCGPQSQVIRTTGNGAPACKICGTAYKTGFKRADGKRANLLELESSRPYISLVVVTRHDTNSSLFNTKFRLNFGRLPNATPDQFQDILDNPNELLIGRSSSCNMVLDYRTVSTIHAKISYENGGFYLQDKKSSNGTMMYLQEPFPLSFSHPCRLRMGRTTISLQPKRSLTASLRDALTRRQRTNVDSSGSYLTAQQFQNLMAGASMITPNSNTAALMALNTNLSRPGSALAVATALGRGGHNHHSTSTDNANSTNANTQINSLSDLQKQQPRGFVANFTPGRPPMALLDSESQRNLNHRSARANDLKLLSLTNNNNINNSNSIINNNNPQDNIFSEALIDGGKNLTGRYNGESYRDSPTNIRKDSGDFTGVGGVDGKERVTSLNLSRTNNGTSILHTMELPLKDADSSYNYNNNNNSSKLSRKSNSNSPDFNMLESPTTDRSKVSPVRLSGNNDEFNAAQYLPRSMSCSDSNNTQDIMTNGGVEEEEQHIASMNPPSDAFTPQRTSPSLKQRPNSASSSSSKEKETETIAAVNVTAIAAVEVDGNV